MSDSLRNATRISLIYVAIGACWILASDILVEIWTVAPENRTDVALHAFAQTLKGWFYVLVTGAILWWLIWRTLQRLEHTQADYKTVFELGGSAKIIAATDGTIERVNKELCRMLGYDRSELEGLRLFTDLLPADLRDTIFACHTSMLGGAIDAPPDIRECRITTKDGQTLEGVIAVAVMPGGQRTVSSFTDLSVQKKLQRQLEQSQRLEAVARLAAGIAHDFNNMLTAIRGYAGFITDAHPAESETHQDAREIVAASNRAAELTRQILTFSARQPKLSEPHPLDPAIQELEPLLRRTLGEDIQIQLKLQAAETLVPADQSQIDQIILNLAVNARDAMPTGGMLFMETKPVALDAFFCEEYPDANPGDYVRLTVSDTGQGINADVLPHIFEPFFTTKTPDKGTGLGLATVFGIVRQLGGYVSVYSEPGKGTSFLVYLPIAQHGTVDVSKKKLSSERPARPQKDTTVLLVEDDPALLHVAEKILSHLGYRVMSATRADEARDMFASASDLIDILVTDVVLVGESGAELAMQLHHKKPDMPIVFVSGYSDHAALSLMQQIPDARFLQKPFSATDLSSTLQDALQ